jgi:prolyl-tRNA editing enzyme YbaK/EbsC (Cys-tRNA(Pro) deacylase)
VIPEKVRRVLVSAGLEAVEFDEGTTPTAPMAAAALGVEVGQIAKSLLFKGKDERFCLVVCPGDRRVSNAKLKAAIGVKARMATAEETHAITGFSPGGVCPFGVDGVDVLLDRHLERWATIYPAAGTDGSGVPMTLAHLASLTAARVADLTEPPAAAPVT